MASSKKSSSNRRVNAPKMGQRKKVTKKKVAKKKTTARRAASTAPQTGTAFVCKMGEGQVGVEVSRGETVLDMLRRAEFPPGTFKTQQGGDIRNLIQAAESEVSAGRASNIAACFQDLRVNAEPGNLESPVEPGAVVTLVPKITGG